MLARHPSRSLYCLSGFAFGLLFPVLAFAADIYLFRTAETIAAAITLNPIHLFIMSAPFVLGATFCLIGKHQQRLARDLPCGAMPRRPLTTMPTMIR